MKKSSLNLIAGFVVMGTSSIALAQTVTNTRTGATIATTPAAEVDITLTGSITSSVSVAVTGALLSAINETGNPSTATVDFGAFSTSNPTAAVADIETRNGANDGAIIGVDLSAAVTFSGANGATLTLERASAAAPGVTDIPLGDLRYGADGTVWASNADGTAIDINGGTDVDVCGGACTSGAAIDHEITLHIPDTRAAGAFTTVVTYTGTIN